MNPMPLSTETNFAARGSAAARPTCSRSTICTPLLEEQLTDGRHVRGRDAVRGDALGREAAREVAAADVEADRQVRCPARRPTAGPSERSPRYGRPNCCGSPVKRTPRCPSAAHRSTSATVASTSQNGVAVTGRSRRGSAAHQSVSQSLYGAHARELELGVVEREERLVPEAADVRVHAPAPRCRSSPCTRAGRSASCAAARHLVECCAARPGTAPASRPWRCGRP